MAWRWLRVIGAARGRCHTDEALVREITRKHLRFPPGCHGARGGVGRSQHVHVGRHRVVQKAWLSTGVHSSVPLHELPPGEWLGSASLEGEVGEVVRGEPKCSCIGFGPTMAMIVSSEKPRTNVTRPTPPVRTLGRAGQAKVRPTTNSAGPV
jgi:hypothetical protein